MYDQGKTTTKPTLRRRAMLSLFPIVLLAATGSLLWHELQIPHFYDNSIPDHVSAKTNPPSACGNTSAEARTRSDCHFDVMSFSWLPTRCFDQELTNQFLAEDSWRWYSDMHMTRQIERAVVLRGEHDSLYVTRKYHLLHCLYMWRKLHRAVNNGGPIDGYIGNYHHTVHCGEMFMLKDTEEDEVDTIITAKYPSC